MWRRLGSATAGTDNNMDHKATWSICVHAQISCCVQMEDSEGTVRQIGVFSEGIDNLTVSVSSFVFKNMGSLRFVIVLSFSRAC